MRNSASESSIARAASSASWSSAIAAFGSRPQASATASVVVAWISWARATGSHARATRIASRAQRWASEKMPSSMLQLREPREDRRARDRRLARDQLDRPDRGGARARWIARGVEDVGHPLVEQPHLHPVAARIEQRDRRLEVGDRARRSPGRLGAPRRRAPGAPPGRPVAAAPVGRSGGGLGPRAGPDRSGRARAPAIRARRRPRIATPPGPRPRSPRRGPRRRRAPPASAAPRPPDGRRAPTPAPRGSASSPSGSRSRSTARAMSSWRNPIAPSWSTRKPCSRPSPSPAVRSASRSPLPRRGPLTDRGAGRLVSASKRAPTARELGLGERRRPPGPAGAGRVGTRGCGPTAGRRRSPRAIPSSDAVGSSRRAASSSSATSGLPPERSATSSRRLADARSPSMPSMRAASSPRSSPARVRRSSGRGAATTADTARSHGSSRGTMSGWSERDRPPAAGGPRRAPRRSRARASPRRRDGGPRARGRPAVARRGGRGCRGRPPSTRSLRRSGSPASRGTTGSPACSKARRATA